MKRLIAAAAALCVLAFGAQAHAQAADPAPKSSASVEAAGKLPESLMLSMQVAYICQGVQGVDIYNQVKDISYQLTLKISEDEAKTKEFINLIENQAKQLCPETATCWREFLKMPNATEAEGKAACEKVTEAALGDTLKLVKIITGDNS
ncbi:hypothetical protein PQU92_15200 [Asticcacaulis sp. BYS171W]|uniref:Secreted protein n=1 Tax=Asticcacaulis aquaticus TaxID=2984212 RepID=A0ABT5HX18_9CAUL|nr:hypothetical protein [Asticcacaulis aquaticus]MDC7684631.1 hypothetical protein [Asticcacaulis aquaticus]